MFCSEYHLSKKTKCLTPVRQTLVSFRYGPVSLAFCCLMACLYHAMKHRAEIAKLSLNCSCKSTEYRNLDVGVISCIYMRPHNRYSAVHGTGLSIIEGVAGIFGLYFPNSLQDTLLGHTKLDVSVFL